MDAQYLANIATIIGVIGALIGFAWGLYQFHRDAILRRVDHLGRIRSALVSNPESSEILHLLDTDDPRLAEKPVLDRRAFVCLMEEVALLERRDLIRPDLAYYMFGYAAIRCAESDRAIALEMVFIDRY